MHAHGNRNIPSRSSIEEAGSDSKGERLLLDRMPSRDRHPPRLSVHPQDVERRSKLVAHQGSAPEPPQDGVGHTHGNRHVVKSITLGVEALPL
eukprot:809063-Alexandrium_andersonii.AAC.1